MLVLEVPGMKMLAALVLGAPMVMVLARIGADWLSNKCVIFMVWCMTSPLHSKIVSRKRYICICVWKIF